MINQRFRWHKLLIVMFSTAVMTACSDNNAGRNEIKERRWTEDVTLEDGSALVVERSATFRERLAWTGDANNRTEIEATLSFTGALSGLPAWRDALVPMVLYRDPVDQEFVMVATTTACGVWQKRGAPQVTFLPDKPNTQYFEFKLAGAGWFERPLSIGSIGRSANLLTAYQAPMSGTHVTAEQRRERQSSPAYSRDLLVVVERPEVNCTPTTANAEQRVRDATVDPTTEPRAGIP